MTSSIAVGMDTLGMSFVERGSIPRKGSLDHDDDDDDMGNEDGFYARALQDFEALSDTAKYARACE